MKVAIADDDPIVCSSLATILAATGAAEVPWTANSGEAAMSKYDENVPDMLLIDVQMPGMDGLTASERILHAHPDARILVLTTFADEAYIAKAMEIGTKGYLIKQDVSSVIPAVQAVMAGRSSRSCGSPMVRRQRQRDRTNRRTQGGWMLPTVSRISPTVNVTWWSWSPRALTTVRSRRNCS